MKIIKEMNKIMLRLLGTAIVMMAMLQVGRIEVKAAEPNYLTFEALEDGSQVGFSMVRGTDSYVQYQKFDGNEWGDWSEEFYVVDPSSCEYIYLDCGEKVRFKGKNAKVFFGGTTDEYGLELFGYIDGKVKVSGDITSLTNEEGNLKDLDSVVGESEYDDIFKGCTGLVSAKELVLPSTILSNSCYSRMFWGCTSLTSAPELPATTLADGCYSHMFWGCTSLTSAPKLPATTLADECYSHMFWGCTSLTSAPELLATTLADNCCSYMFLDCTSLTSAPKLWATKLEKACYDHMFENCTSLISAPELPATELVTDCYNQMFINCKSLQSGPSILPAMKLVGNCYSSLFLGCEALTEAPELPATELTESCYSCMFLGCEALIEAPELPATKLAKSCYEKMFSGCSSLERAPKLPATKLKANCYRGMFERCSSLKRATNLLGLDMTDAPGCCADMYKDCISLETVSNITVIGLAQECFSAMFYGCENLVDIHGFSVPNLALQPSCFWGMFYECKNLSLRKDECEGFEIPWKFSAIDDDLFREAVLDMFYGCDVVGLEYDDDFGYLLESGHTYYLRSIIFNIMIEESENGTVTSDKSEAIVGETVELTVIPDEGCEFYSWVVSDGVDILDDNTFEMPYGDVTIKAIFRNKNLSVTIYTNGHGTAIANPQNPRVGEEVLLTAYPEAGYVLDRWESDDVTIKDNKFIMPAKLVIIKAIFNRSSKPKPFKLYNKEEQDSQEQENQEIVYVDHDTFKSELPGRTVLTMDVDDFKQFRDMKVHSLDKVTVANQKLIADSYASQMKKKAKILHTYGIYTRSEVPLVEVGARKVLAWNNLSIKTPRPIYAACYNQKDGAYLISGNVNENGTAVLFDFRLNEATNVTIFILE